MIGTALSTDLYELTMLAGYHAAGLMPEATFELYVRELPPNRNFLVSAGLEQALHYLENLRFTPDDIEHLRGLPNLKGVQAGFFDEYLPRFRFTGEVWAIDEGVPVFPPEPLLRVTAPLPEAQVVETALLAHLGFQTSVASRAARIVGAAAGRVVVEFGARRAQGIEAGVVAARAAFLSGCESTSNVEAGRRFGIPVSGTMAHSWVTAFSSELSAFCQYAEIFGERTVLLLDTYDTVSAAQSIVSSGLRPGAVRIDSGNLIELSTQVRAILDEGGLRDTTIFVSGDLDEWRIADIVNAGAPVDGFGVGAALSTASDAPSLGAVYKLVEIERGGAIVPVRKQSPGKQTHPGRKQVWRVVENGEAIKDIIDLAPREGAGSRGRPLLKRVMRNGRREAAPESLATLRARSRAAIAELPISVRRLRDTDPYPVRFGNSLKAAIERNAQDHLGEPPLRQN
jgi:nicotinate phosphoribosyltransferase